MIDMELKRKLYLLFYYGIAQFLPDSYSKIMGKTSNAIRVFLCKKIFKKCGSIRTINRRVNFGSGIDVVMGDESGIGARTQIPNNTIIGNHVILSRDCFILDANHRYDSLDLPINDQGMLPRKQTIIEDDVWIGLRTIMTPGRIVRKGTIVGMGTVLTKDFPEYSVVGGNPSKLIKSRKEDK